MALNNHDQDLPAELLEKLENLKVELEDGDITQKGYDKKRTTLLEKHEQEKKEQEDALLASLGPEPSAADVVDFLDYLPSPTHSPPRPTSGEHYMEQHHLDQQQQQQEKTTIPTTRTSSMTNHNLQNRYPPTADTYYQQQQQQQQQHMYPPQPSYPTENTHQYYPTSNNSPRPNRPYDPRMVHPQQQQQQQYYPSPPQQQQVRPMYPQQQQQQQRPMQFPGGSYSSQPQPRPMYSNQPRPMYRPNMPRPNGGGGGGAYYRPTPPQAYGPPPSGYPMQGRSPTLDQQRVPYGYNGGGISRSSTQNSSQGRYS